MADIIRSSITDYNRYSDLEKYDTIVLIKIIHGDISLLSPDMNRYGDYDNAIARILAQDIINHRNHEQNIGETTYGYIRQKMGIELTQMFAAHIFTTEVDVHNWIAKKVYENRLDDTIVAALYEIVSKHC